MIDWYELIGQTPVKLEINWNDPASVMQLRQFEDAESRRVMSSRFFGLVWVSTVFLGLDHNFGGGPPVLFETMAFWEGEGGYNQERCSTWSEAEAMHAAMCAHVTRPRAVWDYFCRSIRQFLQDARFELEREWRRFRGVSPSELEKTLDEMKDTTWLSSSNGAI